MRRLPLATLLSLSAAPLAAGLPPDVWFSPCNGPAATCVSASPADGAKTALVSGPPIRALRSGVLADGTRSFFEPAAALPPAPADPADLFREELAYFQPQLTPIPDDALEILRRWETASRTFLPVTEAERLRLRFDSPDRTGHELDLACEFQGTIDADDLARRYDWTTVSEVGDLVELTAVPKDEVERLFIERVSVTLDAKTWRPTGLLCGRLDRPGTFANATIPLRPWGDDATIQLVGFESDGSDRNATDAERPIRTADLSDDSPRLTRDDCPLTLPPAPAPLDFVAVPLEPVEAPRPAGRDRDTIIFYVPIRR